PFMAGDFDPGVEHRDRRCAEPDPDTATDQPRRHRILTLPNGDPGVAIYSRFQGEPSRKLRGRQWPQQRLLHEVVMADRRCSVGDAPIVVFRIRRGEQIVELGDRVDGWHRDAVVASEPAAFTLDAAFLVSAIDTGLA